MSLRFKFKRFDSSVLDIILRYIVWKKKLESPFDIEDQFGFLEDFIEEDFRKNPLKELESINSVIDSAEKVRKDLENFFEKNHTNDQLQEEFFKKFDEILYEPMLLAFGAENTKNWLLQHEGELSEEPGDTPDQALLNAQETAINNINSAFSNHWWDSDEKKIKSLVSLYYRYETSEDVPKIIGAYIYFSVEELLKKNPDLKEKVEELQEVHDKAAREANRIESERGTLGTDDN